MIKHSIVLVPFPFDDFSTIKVRPTNEIGDYDHVMVAFISSRIPDQVLETDLLIDSKDPGFKDTGLLVTSIVRLHKLISVPRSLLKRSLGRLGPLHATDVARKLNSMFD